MPEKPALALLLMRIGWVTVRPAGSAAKMDPLDMRMPPKTTSPPKIIVRLPLIVKVVPLVTPVTVSAKPKP